jgi:mannitol/fructose-specific phosphotransferase system IIA component (Ntr-type)
MKLSDIMITDAIIPELSGTTRDEVITELIESLANAGAISKRNVQATIEAVLAREAQATTGIGKGVALPHAKFKGLNSPIGTIGRSAAGVDFSALDSKPVFTVILLLSSPDNPDEHLQAMETIFKHVQRDNFRKWLRQSGTREEMIELLKDADEPG